MYFTKGTISLQKVNNHFQADNKDKKMTIQTKDLLHLFHIPYTKK